MNPFCAKRNLGEGLQTTMGGHPLGGQTRGVEFITFSTICDTHTYTHTNIGVVVNGQESFEGSDEARFQVSPYFTDFLTTYTGHIL